MLIVTRPKLIVVPDRMSIFFNPTPLRPFKPSKVEHYDLFIPGASGSPIVYKDHVVGLVPFSNVPYKGSDIAAVLFSGKAVLESMEEFGLKFDTIR